MDYAVAPEIQEAIRERASHPVYGYPIRQDGFYESLMQWSLRRYAWELKREWLCYAPGVVPAINAAVLAYTRPGDKVIIQGPVYHPFRAAIVSNGRQLVDNALKLDEGGYRMDLAALESAIDARTKLLILCNPHNPVGRVWTSEELASLAELCARRGLVVLSDEIHADILMPGRRHVPFASVSAEAAARSVTCLAVSKTFNLAGLCAANVVIPDRRLRDEYQAVSESLALNVTNVFGVAAQEAAYTRGEPWLTELLSYLAGNYARLSEALAGGPVRVMPLEGTYLAWLDCRALGLDDEALKAFFLDRARLWLDEGVKFGPQGSGFMRLNLACPRATLDEALTRLAAALAAR
jgi:cystathionine beta-lyase